MSWLSDANNINIIICNIFSTLVINCFTPINILHTVSLNLIFYSYRLWLNIFFIYLVVFVDINRPLTVIVWLMEHTKPKMIHSNLSTTQRFQWIHVHLNLVFLKCRNV